MSELAADHALLIDCVRDAGALALEYFQGEVEHWDKAPGDPVSEADHAVDEMLRERLGQARPDYGWLSEETVDTAARLDRRRIFVVDPIDGTRAFLRGEPEFTVSAALVEDGRAIAGVVFNPVTEELFEAARGTGARLNTTPIRASGQAGWSGARVISGTRMFARAGWDGPPEGAEFFAINSIAYRMSLVAAGRYDACVSLGEKSEWDIAGATVILDEAGGRASTARGAEFGFNQARPVVDSVVVAGPAMHEVLCDFLDTIERPPGVRW